MKTCDKCGKENSDNAIFCLKCGNELTLLTEIDQNIIWPLLDSPEKIQKAVQQSYPSKNGLKWTEILFLSYARSFFVGQTEFPIFWYEKYGIDNPQQLIQSLIDRGFLQIASNETSLKRFTLPELKEILRQHNFTTTGKKKDLIDRILQNVSADYLEKLLPNREYEVTELGESEIQHNKYVIEYNFQSVQYGVDVWWLNRQLHKYPHMNYRDLIWGELNRQIEEIIKKSDKGKYESLVRIYEDMVRFLLSERKNYNQALTLLCQVYFYKANIVCVNQFFSEKESYDFLKSSDNSFHLFEPSYSKLMWIDKKSFLAIRDGLGVSNDDFFGLLVNNLNIFHCPNPVIDNYDLAGIIVASIEDNSDLVDSVLHKIETKLSDCQ